jgi:esterase/lipase superfamily enzyme
MLMVSCRKDFWSATDFSAEDEIRSLDFGTSAGQVATKDQLVQKVHGRRVMVLVHGYNNEERDVISSYRTIDDRMRMLGFLGGQNASYDVVVGFAWPGGAVGVSFPFARQRAGESARRLASLLSMLRSAGATIDLNSHSLGAHVSLEALTGSPSRTVRNAWNFAAAVDNESIERGERYYQATTRCQRFYVFHSKNDPVLRMWYRAGDFFDFDTALGYSGPEDPGSIMQSSGNVRVINCKDVVQSHGGYRSSGEVWSYMSQELSASSRLQFVSLARTPEALNAVFRATGGQDSRRASRSARTRGAGRPARTAAARERRTPRRRPR